MNDFLKEFKDRGYFYQCTDEKALSKKLNEESIKGYIGFDCTAQSLHVGSLLQIMCLRLLQKHGHRPIVLLGGGTTRIGDPSGKDKTRKILEENEIEKNIKSIENILKKFPIDMIQLHGQESPERVYEIKKLTNLPLMKAIGVRSKKDLNPGLALQTSGIAWIPCKAVDTNGSSFQSWEKSIFIFGFPFTSTHIPTGSSHSGAASGCALQIVSCMILVPSSQLPVHFLL